MALDTFDTVLSFAAVMLVLSMFVTACVQLASAFFRLRSGSLAWGLQQMFEQLELERVVLAEASDRHVGIRVETILGQHLAQIPVTAASDRQRPERRLPDPAVEGQQLTRA